MDIVELLRGLVDEWWECCGDIHEPLAEAADKIKQLREALKECAADFTTKSSDHRTAAQEILDEFERRALIARNALKGDE